MSKKTLSNLFRRWTTRGRTVSTHAARRQVKLRLEEVEQRVVPATLPPVTASDTRVIQAGAYAPQAVADPTNPNLIVVVSASTNSQAFTSLIGQITRDGGQTWNSFSIPNPDTGINAGPGGTQLTNVNTPGVAMSRTGDLYVVWTSTTADFTTAGRLRVDRFSVQQTQPADTGTGVTLANSNVLYQWLGQDPVYNPTVAVDNNIDQFTDPDTGLTSSVDTMLGANGAGKAVYVAWNTNDRRPQADAFHQTPIEPQTFTPTAIFAAASRDRGASWSTPVPVNQGGFAAPLLFNGPGGGVAPRVFFTPGDLNPNTTDTAGRLIFVWSQTGGGTTIDTSTPDGAPVYPTQDIANQATTVYQSPTGPSQVILEPTIDPNNQLPDFPNDTVSTIQVAIDNSSASTNGAFFNQLSDIDVTMAIAHPHVNQLRIFLQAPDGTTVQLLESRVDGYGNQRPTPQLPFGLPDNNDTSGNSGIGVNNIFDSSGTVFDQEAARFIYDPANTAPYIAHFKPEGGSLSTFYGRDVSQLNGAWKLIIQDVRDDDRQAGNTPNVPTPFLKSWSMKMSSLIRQGFGTDRDISFSATFHVAGATANLGGTTPSNAIAAGIGPGLSFAYDSTQGSFSPFSGRLYVAYTSAAGDIFVNSSDDSGASWNGQVQVNDDSLSDNFTEGNRSQFMPSITVDPVTGTVVVMWYDARWDASDARVATYMSTSIDGGQTWSEQGLDGFLNATKDATDQLTRSVVHLEPLPANLRAAGVNGAGGRQSVLAYGGQIKPFWTGNDNANGSGIYTATVQTSAGPRVIDNDTRFNSDQGAVTGSASTGVTIPNPTGDYNTADPVTGATTITGLTVTFDRNIDVSSFSMAALAANPNLIRIYYRAPGTDRSIPATLVPISAILPLDPATTQPGFPDDATRFFVQLATPQTAPGTYSYEIGPYVSDRIRSQRKAVFTPPDTPSAIPDLGMVESTLSVPVLLGLPAPTVQKMEVKVDIRANPNNLFTYDDTLKLTLFGPDPDGPGPATPLSIVLSNRNGSGNNYTNTRFNDSAVSSITAGPPFASPPFTGTFKPEQPLSTFTGSQMAGTWTLRVEDVVGGDIGTLLGWSITFLDNAGNPITVQQSKTFMDQDGDARTREVGTNYDPITAKANQSPLLYTDSYTAPGSGGKDKFNRDPLSLPTDPNTLPLISTGPHLVLVGQPNEVTQVSFATRDATNANVLHIKLDRAVDITTFDPSDIVSVVNQSGPVNGTFNIVPVNAANEIASQFDLVYSSGTTLPTGKYTVNLGSPNNFNYVVADGKYSNTSTNQVYVRFDRFIDPSSFTPANVLRIMGPTGEVIDQQDVTVLGTAGTFQLTFDNGSGPQQTASLPYNIPASGGTTATSSLQNAIAALTNVGAGNVVVTQDTITGGTVYHVTFTGQLRSNQPKMTATAAGGASASVVKGINVTPVPTKGNGFGGFSAFTVSFPTQQLSGNYTIEFGQDPLGNSIHASNVPQEIDVHYVAPIVSTVRTGAVGSPEIQQVQVIASSGFFQLTFNGWTTNPIAYNASAATVKAALDALPSIGGVGGAMVVTSSGQPGNLTYTITFGGTLASSDQPQMTAAFTAPRNDLTVTFDHDVTAGQFTAADIVRVTGPSGDVSLTGVTVVQDSPRQWRIVFPSALPVGQYVIDLAPVSASKDLRVANSGPAIDSNFNAGLDTLRGDDAASQDLDPVRYMNQVPVAIAPAGPDSSGNSRSTVSESYIVINDDYIIRQSNLEQIRVLLNITHPDVRDLDIDLVPPDSTGLSPIRLFTGSLTTSTSNTKSANFVNTVLVDRVGDPNVTNIEAASPPFLSGGSFYSPQTPLSALVGKSAKGVWTLRITNNGKNKPTNDPNYSGEPIQISNWALTLPRAQTVETQVFNRTSGVAIAPATVTGGTTTPSVTNSTIFIPVDFTIDETTLHQIQMLFNISHPNVRDLDIDLIPPAATGISSIRLFTGADLSPTPPNKSANFTNTRIVDRVGDPNAPSLENAVPPFNAGEAGFFSPQNPLNVLVGKSTIGNWTLRVTNHGVNAPSSDPNFDPNAPIQIKNWQITFPRTVTTTGLGQANADRFQAGFRIFTQDPTNALTQQTWTPVGPAPTNEGTNSARISAVAVDPSDPSGNTAYVAVAGGGIWKTTDFLSNYSTLENGALVPRGPSYVPLTDFGPTSAVNVSSLALFPRNNDPHQTIIFALTGEGSTLNKQPGSLTATGVGVIRSLDGGRTWQVLDSTTNVDSAGNVVLMSDQNTRDHLFVGSTGFKIVVDPTPGKDGGVIVYMALSGSAAQNGIWRSLNGGNTWTRVQAGNATDVVLAAGSANPTDPATGKTVFEGNLQTLYAGFKDTPAGASGVYKTDSAPAAASLTYMAGGTQNPLIRDVTIPGTPQITTNLPSSTPGNGRRIALAVPALTGDPLKDSFLKDWVYAMSTDPNGAVQLYLTKDAGAHWTLVRVPSQFGQGTNNESTASISPRSQFSVGTQNDYNMAITVDPTNPYIVYMAGTGVNSIRLDLTKIRDAHNFTFYNNSDLVLGAGATPQFPNPAQAPTNPANPIYTTEINAQSQTFGGLHPQVFIPPVAGVTTGTPAQGDVLIGGSNFKFYADGAGNPIDFLNLFGGRDYNQPFTSNSLIRVENTGNFPQSTLAGFFINDGADISWSPFNDILDPNVPSITGDPTTENRNFGSNTHVIVSMTDPVTGKPRLIFGTDDGVFTGVDSQSTIGSGTLSDGIGFSQAVHGNRNGNLQVAQFYSGGVQTSQLAADLAGALFYGMGDESGFPVSSPNILATGDLNWRGPTGDGASVLIDQGGSGTVFQYRSPGAFGFDQNQTATSLDFFRVLSNTSDHAFGGGFSRTGNSSGSLFDFNDFWPNTTASQAPIPIPQPAVNPLNPNVLLFGSLGGRVFRSTDQGITWVPKAQPGDLDGSPVLSVAFGSSDPAKPTITNNFLYAGTQFGQVYATTTGGAPWTLIGSPANNFNLNGGRVVRIVPNPAVGSKDVFVLTTNGVYYKQDGTTATGNWVNITGNLFSLTRSVFGNLADQDVALKPNSLSALAVDWRYAFPIPSDPSHTFPILYVAGDGGVFRTVDFGTTWTFFPDMTTDGAPADGGYLPNTHITDLDLSIGDLDSNTGKYKPGGFNMLVATTYGRGTFAIRLSQDLPPASFISGPRVIQLINPNPVGGPSTELDVKFSGPVDPATFTTSDIHLVGPNGTVIPITAVRMISTPDADGVNPRNLFAITFPTQTSLGSYDLTVGYNPTGGDVPSISDPSGFRMNQNGNNTNGEAVVDQYRNTILLNSTTNNRLVVTQAPATATAGVPVQVTIQARDTNDLLLKGVNGTLTLSPAPGTGTFTPTTATLVDGTVTFTVTYQTAGSETINVSFSSPPSINGTSWTTTVSAGAATQIVINPPSATLTAPANQSFTVTAQDQFGNTADYNQTVAITSTGAAATLPASVNLVHGTATFNGTFNTSGNVQITATGSDPSNPPSGTLSGTANIIIRPGNATHIGATITAGPYAIGDTATVTVKALDSQGNVATNLDGTTLIVGVNPAGSAIVAGQPSLVFNNGVVTYTIKFTASGTYTITNTAQGPLTANIGPLTVNAAPPPPSPTVKLPGIYAVGTGVGGSTTVTVFNGDGTVKTQFDPFPPGFGNEVSTSGPGFLGGIRTAVADVTGDGIPDYIVGSGPGISATVLVVDGKTGKTVLTYRPFDNPTNPDLNFKGGVFVAAGDITGDGIADIAITPDEGGGPRVVVLRGGDFTRIGNFFGINDPNFRGGARPAIGDMNGDGFGELVISAGFGGGPRISIFDGAAFAKGKESHPIGDFFMFEDTLRNGVYVAVGDVDGDGYADIIGGAGPGGGPRVLVLSGKKLIEAGPDGPYPALAAPIANFFGGDIDQRGGVRVAAKNIDGDRNTDIVTGSGATDENGNLGGSNVSMYLGTNLVVGNYTPTTDFDLIPGYFDGVFVG
jgi:subtilisin-like proprotein convertase family protein